MPPAPRRARMAKRPTVLPVRSFASPGVQGCFAGCDIIPCGRSRWGHESTVHDSRGFETVKAPTRMLPAQRVRVIGRVLRPPSSFGPPCYSHPAAEAIKCSLLAERVDSDGQATAPMTQCGWFNASAIENTPSLMYSWTSQEGKTGLILPSPCEDRSDLQTRRHTCSATLRQALRNLLLIASSNLVFRSPDRKSVV